MILRYGRGKVIFDSNQDISVLVIMFRGNPFIMRRKAEKINIKRMSVGKSAIILSGRINGLIFKYFGHLKITKCTGALISGERVNIKIKTAGINLPELMTEYPEDISISPEKLRHTYTAFRKFKGRRRRPRNIAKKLRAARLRRITSRNRGY